MSPGYNPELIDWFVKNGVSIIPGVSSATEIMMACNAGLKLLKVFPFNELGGERFLNAISGPFSDVKFVITGYLDERDLHYVSNKKIAAIGGKQQRNRHYLCRFVYKMRADISQILPVIRAPEAAHSSFFNRF